MVEYDEKVIDDIYANRCAAWNESSDTDWRFQSTIMFGSCRHRLCPETKGRKQGGAAQDEPFRISCADASGGKCHPLGQPGESDTPHLHAERNLLPDSTSQQGHKLAQRPAQREVFHQQQVAGNKVANPMALWLCME